MQHYRDVASRCILTMVVDDGFRIRRPELFRPELMQAQLVAAPVAALNARTTLSEENLRALLSCGLDKVAAACARKEIRMLPFQHE